MLSFVRNLLAPCLLLVAAAAAVRAVSRPSESPRPVRFGGPHVVAPTRDDPRVVADEQLLAVLNRVLPKRSGDRTNVLLHALRLWGDQVRFASQEYFSGEEMRDYFLDDSSFHAIAGDDAPPLYSSDEGALAVRAWEETAADLDSAAAHRNDVLATLAEIGLPLETKISLADGEATIADLLGGALGEFHDRQFEYEWTAISYGRYAFPRASWTNRFGDEQTPRDLVRELLEQPWEQGVCGGTHRLEAAVVLLRVDEEIRRLPVDVRRRLNQYLVDVVQRLHTSQHVDGWWDRTWPTGEEPKAASTRTDRLLSTGHHLEWLALAPADVELPREQVVRAAQWLVRSLQEVDEEQLADFYGPYSHAARALCLWRGAEAGQQWRRLHAQDSRDAPSANGGVR